MTIKSINGQSFVHAMSMAYLEKDPERADMLLQGQILNNVPDPEKQALALWGMSCKKLMENWRGTK